MSSDRFDELSKQLANGGTSRRGFLKVLVGAAGAVTVGGSARTVGAAFAATCATQSQSCATRQCCKGYTCLIDQSNSTDKFCCPDNLVCSGRCCPTGALCTVTNKCVCPTALPDLCPGGTVPQVGQCVNKQTDANNCGGCGNVCAQGQTCVAGQCVCTAASCPNGCCMGNTCQTSNDQHCGTGGAACVSCAAGTVCESGTCVTPCGPTTCASGCCAGNTCKAGNTNVACGTNGVACIACPMGTECQNGSCVCTAASCPNGCCMGNTCQTSNDQHCGTGGAACVSCPSGTTCGNGVCDFVCNLPPGFCNATEQCCGNSCKKPAGALCGGDSQCCSNNCCTVFSFPPVSFCCGPGLRCDSFAGCVP